MVDGSNRFTGKDMEDRVSRSLGSGKLTDAENRTEVGRGVGVGVVRKCRKEKM